MEWEEDGEIEWGFDERIGRLVIKGKEPFINYLYGDKTCRMKDYESCWGDIPPWMEKYKNKIQSVVVCYGVYSIGGNAFYGCENLKLAVLPISITSIGNNAFNSCNGLISIQIPNSVAIIGASAFNRCHNLRSVKIPSSVTDIGAYAFGYCPNLSDVSIPSHLTYSHFPRYAKIDRY